MVSTCQVLDSLACENVEAEARDISSINLCRCSFGKVALRIEHQRLNETHFEIHDDGLLTITLSKLPIMFVIETL